MDALQASPGAPWPAVALALVGSVGLVAGLAGERLHRSGWYRRPGDPSGTRLPRHVVTTATPVCWILLLSSAPFPTGPGQVAGAFALLSLALIVVLAAAVDVEVHRLPDVLTLPAAGVAAGATLMDPGPTGTGTALLAGVVVPAGLLAWTLTAGGIGLGDVKLSVALSVLLGRDGWGAVADGLVTAGILAGLTALVLLARGRVTRREPLPLGPFLGVGTLLALLG